MCFKGDPKELLIFERDFKLKYTKQIVDNPIFKISQRFKKNQSVYFKYFEQQIKLSTLKKNNENKRLEFPNYYTSLTKEGVIMNKDKNEDPNSVKYAFRYDQTVKCSGFHPQKLKQYLSPQLQEMFGENECCVIYVTHWNSYANTSLFCSNKKEKWQCSSEIEIFRASFYNQCLLNNLTDLHRNIKRNHGLSGIRKSDNLVISKYFFVLNEVVRIDLRYLPKDSELYSVVHKYKSICLKVLAKLVEILKPFCHDKISLGNNSDGKIYIFFSNFNLFIIIR